MVLKACDNVSPKAQGREENKQRFVRARRAKSQKCTSFCKVSNLCEPQHGASAAAARACGADGGRRGAPSRSSAPHLLSRALQSLEAETSGREDLAIAAGLPSAARAALASARDDVLLLRAERSELVANAQRDENSKAVEELSALLASERSARFDSELRLRSSVSSLQAERDTLAARVATLERERSYLLELSRGRNAGPRLPQLLSTPLGLSADPSTPEPNTHWAAALWPTRAQPHASRVEEPGAVRAVQRHLVTVTTDRDLLAADLYRVIMDRSAALRDRDAALSALREASAELLRLAGRRGEDGCGGAEASGVAAPEEGGESPAPPPLPPKRREGRVELAPAAQLGEGELYVPSLR